MNQIVDENISNASQKEVSVRKISNLLWQLHQYTAIALIIVVTLWYLASKEVVNPDFLTKLHLVQIAIILLITHVALGLRAILLRYRLWNTFAKVCVATLFIALIFDYSYAKFFQANETSSEIKQVESMITIPEKIFTPVELATFDGKNGKPAYVAIDGLVYDLSLVFINGNHFGHKAGTDLTIAFKETHFPSILKKYFVVGRLVVTK